MRVIIHNHLPRTRDERAQAYGFAEPTGYGHGWRDAGRTARRLKRARAKDFKAEGCDECRRSRDGWARNGVTFKQAASDLRKFHDKKPWDIADWLERRAQDSGRDRITADDVAALNKAIPY